MYFSLYNGNGADGETRRRVVHHGQRHSPEQQPAISPFYIHLWEPNSPSSSYFYVSFRRWEHFLSLKDRAGYLCPLPDVFLKTLRLLPYHSETPVDLRLTGVQRFCPLIKAHFPMKAPPSHCINSVCHIFSKTILWVDVSPYGMCQSFVF